MNSKFLALIFGWLAITGNLAAQNAGKQGNDLSACSKYQSNYQNFYQLGDFRKAMPWWILAQTACPGSSKNLYIHGVKMFEEKIEQETDPKKRNILIDSLLWVYDCRIKYFSDDPWSPKGYVLGLKGTAIQKFRRQDYPKSYDILGESIKLMGFQSSAAVTLIYMQASQQLFKDGAIDAGKVVADYETVSDIISNHLKKNSDDLSSKLVKEQIDNYFAGSGAATCENMSIIYGPSFPAQKKDAEWLKQVIRQMKQASCTNSNLYADLSEALYIIEPSAEAAHDLGLIFMNKEEKSKAAQYLQRAIDLGKKSDRLADYYYELSKLNFSKLKNYEKARTLSIKAIEARPNWGKPYLLIGQIYTAAHGEVFSDPWRQATVLWAAADKFVKAKAVDPEVADEANQLINNISDHFPDPEMVASRSLRDGDSYTVGGWIKETTRVRSKKS